MNYNIIKLRHAYLERFRLYYEEKFPNEVIVIYSENEEYSDKALIYIICPNDLIKISKTYFNAELYSPSQINAGW